MEESTEEAKTKKFREEKKTWKTILDPTEDEELKFPLGGMFDLFDLKCSINNMNLGMAFQNVDTGTVKRIETRKVNVDGVEEEQRIFRSYTPDDWTLKLKKEKEDVSSNLDRRG